MLDKRAEDVIQFELAPNNTVEYASEVDIQAMNNNDGMVYEEEKEWDDSLFRHLRTLLQPVTPEKRQMSSYSHALSVVVVSRNLDTASFRSRQSPTRQKDPATVPKAVQWERSYDVNTAERNPVKNDISGLNKMRFSKDLTLLPKFDLSASTETSEMWKIKELLQQPLDDDLLHNNSVCSVS